MSDFDEKAQALKIQFLDALQALFLQNSIDIDGYLDLRDSSVFDTDWMKAFELVNNVKSDLKTAEQNILEEQASMLSEEVFIFAMKKTGSSDLAGAISDDAVLIFEAIALQVSDDWINALHAEYLKPSLPSEKLLKEAEFK